MTAFIQKSALLKSHVCIVRCRGIDRSRCRTLALCASRSGAHCCFLLPQPRLRHHRRHGQAADVQRGGVPRHYPGVPDLRHEVGANSYQFLIKCPLMSRTATPPPGICCPACALALLLADAHMNNSHYPWVGFKNDFVPAAGWRAGTGGRSARASGLSWQC